MLFRSEPSAHRTAAVLREAGWRAVVVTSELSMPRAWQLLMAGFATSTRTVSAR